MDVSYMVFFEYSKYTVELYHFSRLRHSCFVMKKMEESLTFYSHFLPSCGRDMTKCGPNQLQKYLLKYILESGG